MSLFYLLLLLSIILIRKVYNLIKIKIVPNKLINTQNINIIFMIPSEIPRDVNKRLTGINGIKDILKKSIEITIEIPITNQFLGFIKAYFI